MMTVETKTIDSPSLLPWLAVMGGYLAWAIWCLDAPITPVRVIITGLAVACLVYTAAIYSADYRLARQQQRPVRVGPHVVSGVTSLPITAMLLYVLAIVIGYIPHETATLIGSGVLAGVDLTVLFCTAMLLRVRRAVDRPKANIAQHEYAVIDTTETSQPLRTRNVGPCTTWYGWDSDHRLAFMAHFDRPKSAKDISKMVDEMLAIVPAGTVIHSTLEGGYRTPLFRLPLLTKFEYSTNTRQSLIAAAARETRLQINVTEGAYTLDGALPWFKRAFPPSHSRLSIDLSLAPGTGEVSYERLCGVRHPKGGFLSKPILRSNNV